MNLRKLVAKAYQSTDRYAVDQLLAEQTRWQRKQTIATNKLSAVRAKLDRLAVELADKQLTEAK